MLIYLATNYLIRISNLFRRLVIDCWFAYIFITASVFIIVANVVLLVGQNPSFESPPYPSTISLF